jgi:hypothetical protein
MVWFLPCAVSMLGNAHWWGTFPRFILGMATALCSGTLLHITWIRPTRSK